MPHCPCPGPPCRGILPSVISGSCRFFPANSPASSSLHRFPFTRYKSPPSSWSPETALPPAEDTPCHTPHIPLQMHRQGSNRFRQNPHTGIDRYGLHDRPLIHDLPSATPPKQKGISRTHVTVPRLIPRPLIPNISLIPTFLFSSIAISDKICYPLSIKTSGGAYGISFPKQLK